MNKTGRAAGARDSSSSPAASSDEQRYLVCSVGHRTPYDGGTYTVRSCPFRIGQRVLCSRTARLER